MVLLVGILGHLESARAPSLAFFAMVNVISWTSVPRENWVFQGAWIYISFLGLLKTGWHIYIEYLSIHSYNFLGLSFEFFHRDFCAIS